MARLASIDLESFDPRPALNAFMWNMNAARKGGMNPPTEYEMIEKLARGEVQFLYYSTTGGGTFSVMESRENTIWDDDFGEELMAFITKTAKRRAAKRRDARNDMRRDMVEGDITPTTSEGDA